MAGTDFLMKAGKKIKKVLGVSSRGNSSLPAETMKPLTISVVTPSFNQGEFLSECLESVAKQTYQPIEHLIYDPGSTDGSLDIARKYAGKHKFATLFNEKDKGQSDAVSKGMVAAKGDIIAWINSDDVFHDIHVFEKVIKRFNQADSPDLVYGDAIYIKNDGKKLKDCYLQKDSENFEKTLQYEVGIIQPSTFFRKEVVDKIGILNLGLEFAMDYDYWIRAAKAGLKFGFLPAILSRSRLHPDNKTLSQRGTENLQVFDFLKAHYGYVHFRWIRRYAEFVVENFDGILSHSANRTVQNKELLDQTITQLLQHYNTSVDALYLLSKNHSHIPYKQTFIEMKKRGLLARDFCSMISEKNRVMLMLEAKKPNGKLRHRRVGGRRFVFEKAWMQEELQKSKEGLNRLKEQRKNDTCVIVGNGPSLLKTDHTLLKGQDVFASNNIFLHRKILENVTYYAVTNNLVAEQNYWRINSLQNIHKFFPWFLCICINPTENTYFLDPIGGATFCKDVTLNISWKSTVTFFLMQLAYSLGYKKVVLVGFDHYYRQPATLKEGDVIFQEQEDINHFSPYYFQGKKWHAADVDNMEEVYKLAKQAFEEDGREIVNATVGGHLDIFRREELNDALPIVETEPDPRTAYGKTNPPRCPACLSDKMAFARQLTGNRSGKEINLYHCPVCETYYNPSGYHEGELQMLKDAVHHANKLFQRNVGWAEKLFQELKKHHPDARTHLDIGASSGAVMSVARDTGLQTQGVEPNPYVTLYAQRELKLDSRVGYFDSRSCSEKYDIITICSVLEHLDNPRKLLNDAVNCLEDDGILFFAVPLYKSERVNEFLENPEHQDSPFRPCDVHVVHFTPKAVKKMVKDLGVEYIKRNRIGWSGFIISKRKL